MAYEDLVSLLRGSDLLLLADMVECAKDSNHFVAVIKDYTDIDLSSVNEITSKQKELLQDLEQNRRQDLLREFCYMSNKENIKFDNDQEFIQGPPPEYHEHPEPPCDPPTGSFTDAIARNNINARDVYMDSIHSGDKTHALYVMIYGGIIGLLSFGYIYLITFSSLPPENARYADICLGIVAGNCLGSVLNLFFGSGMTSPIIPRKR